MPLACARVRPTDEECSFVGQFSPANKNAMRELVFSQFDVRLSADQLWLNDHLSIPLATIKSHEFILKGAIIPRHALKIVFVNPTHNQLDEIYLCDISMFGFYRCSQLQKLSDALYAALKLLPNEPRPGARPIEAKQLSPLHTLFASNEAIEKNLCMHWIQALDPVAALPDVSLPEAHHLIAALLSEKRSNQKPVDVTTVLSKRILLCRILAIWNVFWQLILPLSATAFVVAHRLSQGINANSVASTAIYAALVYPVSFIGFSIIAMLLFYPFSWAMNKHLGLDT